jgi:hypothetical protein
MDAKEKIVVSGALEKVVLMGAPEKIVALIASGTNAHTSAAGLVAVQTACTLISFLTRQTKNAWAYHAATTTTSINARRATTHRFTDWPASFRLLT